MDITVDLKALRPAVAAAKKLAARSYGEKGVTLTAAFDLLHVGAQDSDLTLSIRVPATVRGYGVVTVDCAALSALLRGKGSVILSDAQDGFLRVENGICTDLPVSAAPVAPTAEWGPGHGVDLATVADVAVAASRDEARPILTGVLFDGGDVVATDSYRLHWVEAGGSFPTVLVPSRAFGFLPKVGTAQMSAGKVTRPGTPYAEYVGGSKMAGGTRVVHETTVTTDAVRITAGAVTVTVRTIDGDFPNWRQLVPTNQPHALTVDREAFGKVVCAVALALPQPRKHQHAEPVRLRLDGSELVVWAQVDGREASSGRIPVCYRLSNGR